MSVDYPNREVWLAKRNLQPKPGNYLFISKPLMWSEKEKTWLPMRGITYRAGRTKEKILIWAVKQAVKAERRALQKGGITAGIAHPTVS